MASTRRSSAARRAAAARVANDRDDDGDDDDDEDAMTRAEATESTEMEDDCDFVRELPGASGGLEEATLAAMRGVSLGDACAAAGVRTLARETRDGDAVIDRDAAAATTERALDAAMREKVLVLERYEGRTHSVKAKEGSVQGAFQRAVFAKKLHERITTRVREEVRRRAESDLRTARRAAQERQLSGRRDAKAAMDAKREAPHKPWFLLETPKDEQMRLRKAAMVDAANAEAGADAGADASSSSWTMPGNVTIEPVPDTTDESVLGAVRMCIYMVQSHPRPIQKVLDYLFGYSPAVDGEDLEEIDAYSKGLPVSRGRMPADLAYSYAANLDKTLGERDKVALKTLIKDVKEEWSSHIKAGFDAVKELESTPLDSAEDIRVQNRDSWLRAMFPTLDWPTRNEQNYKFMEHLREQQALDARTAVSTSRPVPLALSRANRAKQAQEQIQTYDLGGSKIHYSKDGVPIIAPDGFFPKANTAPSKRAETARIRLAASDAERRLAERRRL